MTETIKVLDPDAKSTLRQIKIGMMRIQQVDELIKSKQISMEGLRESVNEFKSLDDEVKELKKENQKDRDFIKKSIEFYEKLTGESVGSGPLFDNHQIDESEENENQ